MIYAVCLPLRCHPSFMSKKTQFCECFQRHKNKRLKRREPCLFLQLLGSASLGLECFLDKETGSPNTPKSIQKWKTQLFTQMLDQMGQLTTGTSEAILDVCLFWHIFMAKYIIINIFLPIWIIIMETDVGSHESCHFPLRQRMRPRYSKIRRQSWWPRRLWDTKLDKCWGWPYCAPKTPQDPQDTPRSHHKPKTKLVLSMMMTKMMDMMIVMTMMAMANEKRWAAFLPPFCCSRIMSRFWKPTQQ